ncbi:MAG: T9SS type A sorting domain-containing protein [Janthinobacterium lividum]
MLLYYSLFSFLPSNRWLGQFAALLCLATTAHAQAPVWDSVLAASASQATSTSVIVGVTADTRGNVFVTGRFRGTVAFGNTTLTSAGDNDLFVAKYVPATSTWAWAQQGGGTGSDNGYGIAVSGTSVYVVGSITNTSSNASSVLFGGTGTTPGTSQVNGTSVTSSQDVLLARYTDNGSSATLNWTQVGGGTGSDVGNAVAVSGNSVYMAGFFYNNNTNASNAVFGGAGTTPGSSPVNGASTTSSQDMLLLKYQDNGTTGSYVWSQVSGGSATDSGRGVAVSGTSVYVTGFLLNNTSNTTGALAGGTGTTPGTVPVNGASATSSQDVLLLKYTDQGATAALNWTQVGGGTGSDMGIGVAVSGPSIYVAGYFVNSSSNASAVVFGGGGVTPGTSQVNGASPAATADLLLVKYQDSGLTGSYVWSQVGGGTGSDEYFGLAVTGSSLYVAGGLRNNTANDSGVLLGGGGTTPGTVTVNGAASGTANLDLLLARYTDQGNTGHYDWSLVGGGTDSEEAQGVAISGQQVMVTGYVIPAATFGTTTLATPAGGTLAVVARLADPSLTPLATARVAAGGGVVLYPNPAHGSAAVVGLSAGDSVNVYDLAGRSISSATADASGTAQLSLPTGLVPGVYVARTGTQALRLLIK